MLKYGRITLIIRHGGSRQITTPLGRQFLTICNNKNRQISASRLNWFQRRYFADSGSSSLTLENAFKCYDLERGPPLDVELTRDDALDMYTKMVEVRRLEIIAAEFYKEKKIRGFCHLYNGQEAIAVGMAASLRKMDSVITAYRCHGWTYLMGVSLNALLAELIGVRSGCSRGKGGSMHMYADKFFGGNGIVGAQVPVGVGIALAHRYRDDGGACVACYGDGAANQGQIFEAYNMAKLWCLPCIFVCENNRYGMGTEVTRASANTDFYMRGQYIPGLWVDGNQVLAVRSATQFALEFVQSYGPIVLEMSTYRYMGHSMSDPGTSYRTREEIKEMREARDPIVNFRNQIITLCLGSEEELKKIDNDVKIQLNSIGKKVTQDREVEQFELAADVYARNLEPKIRGVSGYHLNHRQISEVCLGKPKATPLSEIADVPVGDESLKKNNGKGAKGEPGRETKSDAKEGKEKKKGESEKAEATNKAAVTTPAKQTKAASGAAPGKAAVAAPAKSPGTPPAKAPSAPPAKAPGAPPRKAPAANAPVKAPAKSAPKPPSPKPSKTAPTDPAKKKKPPTPKGKP